MNMGEVETKASGAEGVGGGHELHESCKLFPEATEDETAKLAEDIKVHGLLEPIVILDGKVLDGRNRYRACARAGVRARFVNFKDLFSGGTVPDPTGWVLSKNLHRRHLSQSQKAQIAAAAVPLLAAEAAKHKATSEAPDDAKAGGRARDKAAATMGVSGRSVARAERVEKADPELANDVRAGKKSVAQAEKEVKARKAPDVPQTVLGVRGIVRGVRGAADVIRTHGLKKLDAVMAEKFLGQCNFGDGLTFRTDCELLCSVITLLGEAAPKVELAAAQAARVAKANAGKTKATASRGKSSKKIVKKAK